MSPKKKCPELNKKTKTKKQTQKKKQQTNNPLQIPEL